MWYLYTLNEILSNNFNINYLIIVSVLSILSSILIIISKNPIVSILFLIGLFLTISLYLMMLGINFIALSYILVYVGAVSILFLFILMLINVRISELSTDSSNSIPLAVITGISFNLSLNKLFYLKSYSINTLSLERDPTGYNWSERFSELFNLHSDELFFVTSQTWDGKISEIFHITSIGNILYTNFPIWLILVSIILLLAMIGSILITIKP